MDRCEQVDRWNRWTDVKRWINRADGTDGLSGQVDRHEQMEGWNRWTDMNRWMDGMVGQR